MSDNPAEAEVREWLTTALCQLVKCDEHLFTVDANERSLTHRLAFHLERLLSGWDVDCEYNRRGDARKRISEYPVETRTDDDQGRTVYPDVIVHHRGKPSNLLVVEVKKSSSDRGSADDLYKLGQYSAPEEQGGLGYEYGAFVRLMVYPETPGFVIERWNTGKRAADVPDRHKQLPQRPL
jgi:hypothetical protein